MLQLAIVKLVLRDDVPRVIGAIVSDFLVAHMSLMVACRLCPVGASSLLELIWARTVRAAEKISAADSMQGGYYSRNQLEYGLMHSILKGDFIMMQWLLKHFSSQSMELGPEVAKMAAKTGQLWALEVLKTQQENKIDWSDDVANEAAANGHWEIVQYLEDPTTSLETRRLNTRLIASAVAQNDLERVQWLVGKGFGIGDLHFKGCPATEWQARVEIVRILLGFELNDAEGLVTEALQHAAKMDDLEFVQWLISYDQEEAEHLPVDRHYGITVALKQATKFGHQKMMEWLLGKMKEANVPDGPSTAIFEAALAGNIAIVQMLHEQYFHRMGVALYQHTKMRAGGILPYTIMDATSGQGHLKVLQFLHDIDVSLSEASTDDDERNSSWHGRRSLLCTPLAMDEAAANGHFEVVKWLHKHRSDGCTRGAMDRAAAGGHLEVVEWLHFNRSEGCTVAAIDSAARYAGGLPETDVNLAIVRFLLANRSEGCTTEAMDGAAAAGNLEMMQLLHANTSAGCTNAALREAGKCGRFDIVEWLYANGLAGRFARALPEAAERGHLEVVKCLHSKFCDGCWPSLFRAQNNGHVEIVRWLLSNCSRMTTESDESKAANVAFALLSRERRLLRITN